MTDTHLHAHLDADNRVVTFTVKKTLDIAPSSVDVPVWMVKQIAGHIAMIEGKHEQNSAAPQNGSPIVRIAPA